MAAIACIAVVAAMSSCGGSDGGGRTHPDSTAAEHQESRDEPMSTETDRRCETANRGEPGARSGKADEDETDENILWSVTCASVEPVGSVASDDLDNDGVADIVVDDSGLDGSAWVLAIDGRNGEVIWRSEAEVRPITVARFDDLDDDGATDVLVGGRGVPYEDRPLIAMDGRDGTTIWKVEPIDPPWRNVYTPQAVGDLDGDRITDWLVTTSGDHIRGPMEPPDLPARVVLIAGATGRVLESVSLPEPTETYSSPVLITDDSGDQHVLMGSGGEVFPGSLWSIPLASVRAGDSSGFRELLTGEGSSYIAPPSIADLDGDGRIEAVALRMDGTVTALDPFTGAVTWQTEPAATFLEAQPEGSVNSSLSVPALGQLDHDAPLEVVTQHTVMSREDLVSGIYRLNDSTVVVQDGSTGATEASLHVSGSDSVASPLIADVDGVAGVVCTCIGSTSPLYPPDDDSRHASRLGWWAPGTDQVEDTGMLSSLSVTPLLIEASNADGATRDATLFTVSTPVDEGDQIGVITAVRPMLEGSTVTSVQWGGYMGSDHSGHLG